MITIQELIRLLTLEHNLVHTQTDGLTLADTLIQPQPSGNCMNWVLGHLLDYQVTTIKLLGEASPIEETRLERYRTGSEPITGPGPGVLSLEELLSGHDRLHAAIVAHLEKMNDADFNREVAWGDRKTTLSWRIFFNNFHYAYHLGQLELLRQLAGHTEKLL